MADWGILQPTPNFAQSVLGGYQAGQKVGQERAIQSALGGVDLERPESILPLLKLDPQTGSALYGAASKIAGDKREQTAREAEARYLTLKRQSEVPQAPTAPTMATSGTMDATGAPAVPATPEAAPKPTFSPEIMRQAEDEFLKADPERFQKVQEALSKSDETQRKKMLEAQEAIITAAQTVAKLPYAQRKAALAQQRGYLAQHFVTDEMLNNFDPTDQNIVTGVGQALGLKGLIEREDKAKAEARAQAAEARAARGESRSEEARNEGRVRFQERGKDRAAIAGAVTVAGKQYLKKGDQWFEVGE